ncbi:MULTISPECIES: lauroyl acyltransferase [unclassified Saccharibacter]|uniref:LpxL/LpxP family acyltransferase n=1 Tax=unclassified Saccharibacter TaxID=2648722 RepID=UPI00132BAFCD|nr:MULTISPECIES: lauroyl acyltransferase [unclassified Saccharibacter]MXV35360.1 lauroyl acyltransferase [Saccharibacter sp. EH611]MXV57792.1 lauroyl acyltransferase [Saccharibacter sp. EH70]MXV65294.1 lauroyl acyltransferase [Saccharibacter sp. EH60]
MKTLSQKVEFYALFLCMKLLSLFKPEHASTIMGTLLRIFGPLAPLSSIGKTNLDLAFPHLSKQQKKVILRDCWENLGRTFAELPHIPTLPYNSSSGAGWSVEGTCWLEEAKLSKRPIIFFSGHLGNWEIMPTAVAYFGLPFASFYRAPNNPYVDRLLSQLRKKNIGRSDIPSFPKGAKGARASMRYLSQGNHLGILGDQKMNDGICAGFFGRPTMTAPAAAALALKFNALIVTGYVRREGPARLVLEVFPPFDPHSYTHPSQKRRDTIQKVTQILNDRLQEWITNRPGEWLWLHRRWDKKTYR